MNQITTITRKLIGGYFLELEGVRIDASYKQIDKTCYFEWGEYKYGAGYFIEASPTLKKAPVNALAGGLAHELEHIAECYLRFFLFEALENWFNGKCKRFRILNERRTDFSVVQRGLGKELLAFSRWSDEQRKKAGREFNPEVGLTTQELEKIVLKI